MIITNGNLLNTELTFIIHQVNCQGVMGAGIARQIKERFPKAWEQYKADLAAHGDSNLGSYSYASENGKIIFSIFGQDNYGRDKCYTNYLALRRGIRKAIIDYRDTYSIKSYVQLVLAVPYGLGCGLGGGDWCKVRGLLEDIEQKENVVFVAYKLS
jgi:hypothetical protein